MNSRVFLVSKSTELFNAFNRLPFIKLANNVINEDDSFIDTLKSINDLANPTDILIIDSHISFHDLTGNNKGGFELFKHIRLNIKSDKTALLPVIILSLHEPCHYLQESSEELLLYSPNCIIIKHPMNLGDFQKCIIDSKPFKSLDELSNKVKPYVTITRKDQHDYRNKYGIFKFREEMGEDMIPPDYQSQMLPLKYHFLNKYLPTQKTDNNIFVEFRNKYKHHNILLIDDECHNGWHQALSSLCCSSKHISNHIKCFEKKDESLDYLTTYHDKIQTSINTIYNSYTNETITSNEVLTQLDELWNIFPYSLVLLDLRLELTDETANINPDDLSGIKTLIDIKKLFPYLPVIVFTASDKASIINTALKYGALGIWIKELNSTLDLISLLEPIPVLKDLFIIYWKIHLVKNIENIKAWEYTTIRDTTENGSSNTRVQEFATVLSEEDKIELYLLLDSAIKNLIDAIIYQNKEDLPAIIYSLGSIQELRYKNLKLLTNINNFRTIHNSFAFVQSKFDNDLRKYRNSVIHDNTFVQILDAIYYFNYQLNELLS